VDSNGVHSLSNETGKMHNRTRYAPWTMDMKLNDFPFPPNYQHLELCFHFRICSSSLVKSKASQSRCSIQI
jgi:hypothetical protein